MTRRERLSACAVLAGAVAALVLAQVISPAWIPSPASLRLARYAHYMSDQLWALIVAGVARVVGLAVLVGEVRTAWRSRRTGNRQAQRAHPALAGLALMLSAMSFAGTRSATNSGPARATPVSYELVLARSPTPRPPTPSTPNPSTYTVAPNDDLFVIAGKLWANPEAWPHLWVANRGGPAPGGRTFTDPKLIWPGQVLHVPTIHSGPLPRDWTQVPWSGTAGFGSTPSAEISAPPVAPGGNILTPVPGPSNQAADPPAAPQTSLPSVAPSSPAASAPGPARAPRAASPALSAVAKPTKVASEAPAPVQPGPKVPRSWSSAPVSKAPATLTSNAHHKGGGDLVVALPVAVGVAALALGLRRQARIARQRRQAVDVPPRIRPAAAARLRQMDQRAKIARPTIEQVRAVLCELERQAARMAEHVAPPQLVGLVTGGDEVEAVFAAPTPVPPAAPARTLAPNRWAIDSKAITEPTFDAPALALVPLGVAGQRLVWADLVGIGPRLRLVGEGAKDLAAAWAAAISSGVGAHCVRVAVLDEVIPPYPDLLEPANECQAQAARSQQARYGRVHGCEALVSRQAQGSATTPWWAAARPTKVFVCVKAPDDLASGEVAVIVGGEPIEGELVIDTSAPSVDIEAFGLGTLSLVLPEAGDVEALNQELDRLSGPGEPLATLTRPPAALHQSPNVEAVDPELSFSGDASAGSGPGIDADEGINVDGGIDEHPQAASTTLLGHLEVVPVVRLLGPVEGLRPPLSKTEYQVAVLLALARRELPRFGWSEVFHLGEDPARKVIGRIKEKLGHSVLVNRTEKSSYGTTNYDHWVGRSDLDCFDDLIEAGDYVGAFSLIRGPVCCDETWLEDEMEMGLLESTNARIIDTAYRAAAILGPADRQRLRLFVRLGFPLNDTLLELLTPREEPEANLHDDFDAGWEQGDDAVEYRNQSLQDQGRDGD